MVRNQINKSENSKAKLQTKLSSCNRTKKKQLLTQEQEYNFEDVHLAKFFQNHNQLSNNSILNNKNVVVINDDQEDDDRTESITTTITNDSNESNDTYLDETQSIKFDCEIELDEVDTYRIGNWVYCEFESNQPYSIRRIEDLKKKPDGTIEAKLRCAFRRSDLPQSLLGALEKNYSQYFTSVNQNELDSTSTDYLPLTNNLTGEQVYQLKQRELFYSKTIEIKSPFDITCLRGKLELDLFTDDINVCTDYLKSNGNRFFYQINYDPNQKRLSVDKIQIRVDQEKFQADLPDLIKGRPDKNYGQDRETLVWNGNKCKTNTTKLNKYINDIYIKQTKTNLSHDFIMYEAIKRLHECSYDEKKAKQTFNLKKKTIKELDNEIEIEEIDKETFNQAITVCGHDFNQIHKKYFSNKTIQQLIDYYYNAYKRTSDYIKKREVKRLKKKSDKLDLLYIPGSSLTTLNHINNNNENVESIVNLMCSSCNKLKIPFVKSNKQTKSNKKQATLSSNKEEKITSLNENVCNECWIYWKKYGGYKSVQSDLNTERISLQERVKQANSNQTYKCLVDDCGKEYKDRASFRAHALISHALIVKNYVYPRPNYLKVHNFSLIPTQLTKSARSLFNPTVRKLARNPFNKKVNLTKLIETEWFKNPHDITGFKCKNVLPSIKFDTKTKEAKKRRLEKILKRIKLKQTNESDEDLSLLKTTSNNIKKTKQSYVEIWRPLTPISCIVGEEEERNQTIVKKEKQKIDSTFLSPSSSINSTKSSTTTTNTRRRRLDSSSSENTTTKKVKTTNKYSKKLIKNEEDDTRSSHNLSDISDCVETKVKQVKQTKKKFIHKKKLQTKSKVTNKTDTIDQFEGTNDINEHSDDSKENKYDNCLQNKTAIWDEFYFSANNQLKRRLKGVLNPKTLKRLVHSPFLKLKSHLYSIKDTNTKKEVYNVSKKWINQFEKNKSKQHNENKNIILPSMDTFCFLTNKKLRRRRRGILYPETLKCLTHSPFRELKQHLYQKMKC